MHGGNNTKVILGVLTLHIYEISDEGKTSFKVCTSLSDFEAPENFQNMQTE